MYLSWAAIARSLAVTDCSPGTHPPSSSLPVYFANLKWHDRSFFPSIIWTHPLTNWSQNTMDLWLPQDPKWVLNGFPAPGHPFYSHTTPVSAKSFETSLQFLISRKYSRVSWVLLEVWALPCLPPQCLTRHAQRTGVYFFPENPYSLFFSHTQPRT